MGILPCGEDAIASLGVNVEATGRFAPRALAASGAKWLRCVALPNVDISDWISECQSYGMQVLLVLARESFADGDWGVMLDMYAQRYPAGTVAAVQLGNEADHESDSSWTMSKRDFSRLLATGREHLPGRYLVGGGLVSGHPSWLDGVVISPLDAIAAHPYAKEPNTPELLHMLQGYAAYGKPLWATEYHARTRGLPAYFRKSALVDVAFAFCWSNSMVDGFGLIERIDLYDQFRIAANLAGYDPPSIAVPPLDPPVVVEPVFDAPEFILGFGAWAAREPELLGFPIRNERTVAPGWQTQPTSTGLLSWVDTKGMAFVTRDGRVFRWHEALTQSIEIT